MSDAPGQVADPLIAILVDSVNVPPWIADSIAALSGRHPRVLVAITGSPSAPSAWFRIGQTAAEWMRPGREAAKAVPLDCAREDRQIEILHLATERDLETALRGADVVVDLSCSPTVRAGERHVVVTLLQGARKATASTSLIPEFLAGRRTVTTRAAACSSGRTVVVAEARTALIRRSLSASRAAAGRTYPALLLRAVDSARRRDAAVAKPVDAETPISPVAIGAGALRLACEGIRSLRARRAMESRYAVAWGSRDPSDSPFELPRKMHWIDNPHGRFLADPALARHDNRTFVFVEDFSSLTGYATIAVFDPSDPEATFRTVLDRGTHLSYPFVFRDEGREDWLMLPEMAAENCVTLFRASSFPDEWLEDTVLLDNVHAYDPTVIRRDGRYWLFYASGTGDYCFNDELMLASSSKLRGPYSPHPLNPIKLDVIGSRPAGRLFEWNGRLIRPAQDSSREYGYAVVFNEVTELTPTSFAEKPIARLEPDWASDIRSTHSWDFLDDIVVADAKRVAPKQSANRAIRR